MSTTADRDADPPSTPADRSPVRRRRIAVSAISVVGLCELVVTTVSLDLSLVPGWLGIPVAMVGFLAFLVLVGLTGFLGNAVVGGLVLLLLWRAWGWPLWRAVPVAAPYWIVFYRLLPKPW